MFDQEEPKRIYCILLLHVPQVPRKGMGVVSVNEQRVHLIYP